MCFVFFFQAEDGIRDIGVTGVQTCALPILVAGYDALIAAPIATIYACVVAMLTEKTKFQSVIDAAIASVREIQVALFILMIAYAMAEAFRSEEHTSDSSHANISYAVFCLKKKTTY